MTIPLTLLMVIVAYLAGSLSSAVIVARAYKLPDPRTHGSNNPGATNILRIGGTTPAVLVLVADVLKGHDSSMVLLFLRAATYCTWHYRDCSLSRPHLPNFL